jgi:hypothetical protein
MLRVAVVPDLNRPPIPSDIVVGIMTETLLADAHILYMEPDAAALDNVIEPETIYITLLFVPDGMISVTVTEAQLITLFR